MGVACTCSFSLLGQVMTAQLSFGEQAKTLSFGAYSLIGLKETRERRDEAKKLLAQDIDPGAAGRSRAASGERGQDVGHVGPDAAQPG
jgi:hypothetical protein